MRRKTTTILAVVMTASASVACSGATETIDQPSDQAKQQHIADGLGKTAPTPTPAPTPATDAPATDAPAPAKSPVACDRDALNTELSHTGLDSALAQHAHFRCLCDDQGYPLVGNINAKGATASQFCAAIKDKGQL